MATYGSGEKSTYYILVSIYRRNCLQSKVEISRVKIVECVTEMMDTGSAVYIIVSQISSPLGFDTIILTLFEFINVFCPKAFGYISMFVFIGDAVVHVLKIKGKM